MTATDWVCFKQPTLVAWRVIPACPPQCPCAVSAPAWVPSSLRWGELGSGSIRRSPQWGPRGILGRRTQERKPVSLAMSDRHLGGPPPPVPLQSGAPRSCAQPATASGPSQQYLPEGPPRSGAAHRCTCRGPRDRKQSGGGMEKEDGGGGGSRSR